MSRAAQLALTLAAAVPGATPGPTILLLVGFGPRQGGGRAIPAIAGVVAAHARGIALSLADVGEGGEVFAARRSRFEASGPKTRATTTARGGCAPVGSCRR